MLLNVTKEKLQQLKLKGMLIALEEQLHNPNIQTLSFEERFGFIVDKELIEKENRRLQVRLKDAKLKQDALVEDIDFKTKRGLDKSMLFTLSNCEWIQRKQNIIITGPTGAGKSYLACALGNKACREKFTVIYHRVPRLFEELSIGRGDGRYVKMLEKISKVDLLVLDDWGISPLNELQRRDVLEIIEDRYNISSTIIVSQLPSDNWYEIIGEPTIADAILDRLIHNSHKIELSGDSMRKITASKLTES